MSVVFIATAQPLHISYAKLLRVDDTGLKKKRASGLLNDTNTFAKAIMFMYL